MKLVLTEKIALTKIKLGFEQKKLLLTKIKLGFDENQTGVD